MRSFFYFLILFISFGNLVAQNGTTKPSLSLILQNGQTSVEANSVCYFLEDKTQKLDLQAILKPENQIKFVRNTKDVLILKNTASIIWVRIALENRSQQNQWLIESSRAFTDSITLYTLNDSNKVISTKHTGLLVPLKQRDVATSYTLFYTSIPQNSKQNYYFRIKTNKSFQLPLNIVSEKTAFENLGLRQTGQGFYFGFAILITLYNLFLYFSVREKIFIRYVAYVFFSMFQNALQMGFIYQFFSADFPIFNLYASVFFTTAPIFYALFCIEMLNLKQYPKLKLLQQIYIVLHLICAISLFLSNIATPFVTFLRVIVFTQSLVGVGIGLFVIAKGNKSARLFFIATSVLLAGVLISLGKEMGILPYNVFTNNSIQIGGVWEMLMLSFAVGSKINQYRKEKQVAEIKSHKAALENARLVQEQNYILETKVKERTVELQEANEELHQQQEELIATNDALGRQTQTIQMQKQELETTFDKLKTTSDRLDSSIRYAQQIQEVILPDKQTMLNFFDDYFAIYLPKDLVSGDFYWFVDLGLQKKEVAEIPNSMSVKDLDILEAISQKIIFDFEEPTQKSTNKKITQQNQEGQTIHKSLFVLADCTGHGVSGAFMSMIGHTLLHEIVSYGEKTEPAKILRTLNNAIINVLKQKEGKNADGMDISVCLLEKNIATQKTTLTFAGAKTAIYHHNHETKIIQKIKGERIFIGGFSNKERIFTNQIIELSKGDTIYCFSDGYADQNDANRQAMGVVKVEQILAEIQELSLKQQQEFLLKSLQQHQGNEMQRDDITVLGLRM